LRKSDEASHLDDQPMLALVSLANDIDARVIFQAALCQESDNADTTELCRKSFLFSEKIV
jgi:hypothetical protein